MTSLSGLLIKEMDRAASFSRGPNEQDMRGRSGRSRPRSGHGSSGTFPGTAIFTFALLFIISLTLAIVDALPPPSRLSSAESLGGSTRDFNPPRLSSLFRSSAFTRRQTSASTPDGFKVSSLPNIAASDLAAFSNYAGVIPIDPAANSTLFFWLVTPSTNAQPTKRPLIIWLNGGPGCSSMDGLWLENGPYRVVEGSNGAKVGINRPNWVEQVGNVLYIDQPVGTGFSSTGDRAGLSRTEKDMAKNFMTFLTKWFAIFSDYAATDLYLAGESFAGVYIPYISTAILDYNSQAGAAKSIKLKGVAIGNGWIDPLATYASYITFADENKLWNPNSKYRSDAVKNLETCKLRYAQKPVISAYSSCEQILQDVVLGSKEVSPTGKCLNLYDIRLEDDNPLCNGMSWPPGVDDMRAYLVRPDLVKAIHVSGSQRSPVWDECNDQVYMALSGDTSSAPSVTLIPNMIANGIRVMLFSGKSDLICNWRGSENLIANLTWAGSTGFSPAAAELSDFVLQSGDVAGMVTHERNLTFIVINEASHMAPFDQPEATAEMMARFVKDGFVAGGSVSGTRTSSVSTTSRTRLSVSTTATVSAAVVTSTRTSVAATTTASTSKPNAALRGAGSGFGRLVGVVALVMAVWL